MATHHTLATHAHAVGVLVGAPRPIMHQLLQVRHVAALLGLAVQVAALVGCKENNMILVHIYFCIENAEGNVLIGVYLFICMCVCVLFA